MSAPQRVSEAQHEIIVAAMLAQDNAVAMTGGSIDFLGALDAPRFLSQALRAARQADALRSAFRTDADHITQHLVDPAPTAANDVVDCLDFSAHPDGLARADTLVHGLLRQGLDPFGPTAPVRHHLIKIGPAHFRYVIVCHHALMDGWGFQRFVRALAAGYQGGTVALPSFLAQLPGLCAAPSPRRERALLYWQARVPQAPARLFPDPTRSGEPALVHRQHIGVAQLQAWKACAQRLDVSLAGLSSAAVLMALQRLTGVSQPVVGIPVHNRSSAVHKETLGLFAGLQPLTHSFAPGQSLAEVALQLKAAQRADFRHAGLSRADFAKAWRLPADSSEPFPLTFSFEPHSYDVAFGDLPFHITAYTPSVIARPVQMYLREYREGQPGLLEMLCHPGCASAACSPALIETMVSLLDTLAAEQTPAPTQHSERPDAGGLFQHFERLAQRQPEALALSDQQGHTLSYAQLREQALQVAQALRAQGVRPEQFVGLCTARHSAMVVGLLGILAAGAVYVPLDPAYPQERVNYLLSDSGVQVVLADEAGANALAGLSTVQLLPLGKLLAQTPPHGSACAAWPCHSTQAAYVIYTSGSTGKPKGCVVSHGNVLALMDSVRTHGYGPSDRWTLFHSFAFDFSVWEIWGALLHGGQLMVVDQATTRDPEAFVELLASQQITVLSQTPTAFRSLTTFMQLLADEGTAPALSLRRVVFGGEAFNPSVLTPWFGWTGEAARFTNMYGITETTVHVTERDYGPQDSAGGSFIGPALPGWRLYLLNERFDPVRAGETGEIYVGGLGVARGYHARAAMTAQRMLPDPFCEGGARMYRSGDLARLLDNGEVEYIGRADHQLKIRGFRIEAGEVEDALRHCPGVRDAVVAARKDPRSGEDRLVAWLVPQAGADLPDAETVRLLLEQSLPAHCVPARLLPIAQLPLTTNGKLDQAALPDPFSMVGAGGTPAALAQASDGSPAPASGPDAQGPGAQGAAQASPANPAIQAVRAVWSQVLMVADLPPGANFFSLGGDSVVALRILAGLRERGYGFTLVDLYRFPTLERFAERATRLPGPACAPNPAGADTTVGSSHHYPMLALQAGMIYHTELDPRSSVFLDVFDFDIAARWDQAALRRSLEKLVRWAAPLRTRLDVQHADGAMLVVQAQATLPLQVHDLRGASLTEQRLLTVLWSLTERTQPFDVNQAPLMRVTAHVLGDERFRLTFAFHHAILDGWSFASLVSRLLADYAGRTQLDTLPDLSHVQQLASQREQQALRDTTLQAYWAERLRGAVPLHARQDVAELLPVQFKRVEPWDDSLCLRLRQLAEAQGMPLRSLLLGVSLLGQALLTGQQDIVTGYVTHCRPEIDSAQEAPGLFLNTLPLRMAIRPGDTLSGWFAELVHQEADALEHRWLPLAAIQKVAPGWPLFQVGFNFVHFHVYTEQLGQDAALIENVEVYERTDFPLLTQFTVDPRNQAIELTLVPNHIADDGGELRLEHFALVLRRLAQACVAQPQSLGDMFDAVRSKLPADCLANAAHWLRPGGHNAAPPTADTLDSAAASAVPASAALAAGSRETQARILKIWNDVLATASDAVDTPFVVAGGDSIAATRLMARVRREFAVQLPLRLFLEFPTVRGLAAAIDRHVSPTTPQPPATPDAPIARSSRRTQRQLPAGNSHTESQDGGPTT